MLGNLLSNAIKYSPAGGEIVVSVAEEGAGERRRAVLSVVDHGVGIPAADLPHVFERFRRGENVTGRFGGSGVGLASVRQIVTEHGGQIDATSVEGQGSAFTVRLPLAAASSTEGAPAGTTTLADPLRMP